MSSPAFNSKEAAQNFMRSNSKMIGIGVGGLAAMSKYKVGRMTKAMT